MSTKTKNIYDLLEEEINASDMSAEEKNKHLSVLVKMRGQKINLMVVGATGVGKSSTINSIFNTTVAKVGVGVDPETDDVEKFDFENLTVWDTPGLGDGAEEDAAHTKMIIEKLSETDDDGNMLIDLVLVVLDASSKDMKTSCELIMNVLIPCLGKENGDRIMIGINQADMAMKGNHWDVENNCPDDMLKEFLHKKAVSVRERILESTGLKFKPMYYCAGYTDDDGTQRGAYNLTKLLREILRIIPKDKRLAMVDTLNEDETMWEYDDHERDYVDEINESFNESIWDCVCGAAETGAAIGIGIIGIPGMLVGGLLGGVVGCVKGIFKKVANA